MAEATTAQVQSVLNNERERAFVVTSQQWVQSVDTSRTEDIVQGYIPSDDCTVRVRISTNRASGKQEAVLAIKSKREIVNGVVDRDELQWPVSISDAERMLEKVCLYKGQPCVVHKTRHYMKDSDWTVDVFTDPKYNIGKHGPFTTAEIEFEPGHNDIVFPPFISERYEVSDGRFSSRKLAHPDFDPKVIKTYLNTMAKAAAQEH